ncbi:hypothetical protein [Verrucosispora sp. NA02020]|uniref:hypothetical protein n=1 Tax=Verrucosispora sp. NA02020 TaxID=2742132 RepID=UPI003D70DD5C
MTTDTDSFTTSPAEAGQRLIDRMRHIARERVADRAAAQQALDDFLAEVDGVDTAAVETAVREVIAQHEKIRQTYDDAGPRGATSALVALMHAVDTIGQPLAAEVAAAERTLAEREQAASDALAAMGRAVDAGDAVTVMALRGEVEIEHPRRIAEARTALLELRIAQARARMQCTAARPTESARRVVEATQQRDAAAAAFRRASEGVALAELEREWTKDAHGRQAGAVLNLERELTQVQANHQQEMRDRLRRVAGLPEPTPQPQPSALPRQVVQDFSPSETTFYNGSVVA